MADEEHHDDDDLVERIDEQVDEEVLVDHQGRLDEGATICMNRLVQIAAEGGADMSPGDIMSRAIRLYYAAATGGVRCTPSDELKEMIAAEGLGDVPSFKLH